MTLNLNGLEVACIIGERPDERNRLQVLRVDVTLDLDARAADSDDLADTVDYAALAARISNALVAARCQMIERAAKVVYDCCRADARVTAARVTVTKSGAIPNLASASVSYP